MVLRCYAWLLERVEFDWVVTVSGQDYPIRPPAQIERKLAAGPYDGYVEGWEVARPPWTRRQGDEFSRRYHYRCACSTAGIRREDRWIQA